MRRLGWSSGVSVREQTQAAVTPKGNLWLIVLTHTDQLFAVPEVTGEGTGLLDMAMLT